MKRKLGIVDALKKLDITLRSHYADPAMMFYNPNTRDWVVESGSRKTIYRGRSASDAIAALVGNGDSDDE